MYHFIVNLNSRSGYGQHIWASVAAILKKDLVSYQVYFTKYEHHATKIADKITKDRSPLTLIVLGGDGTINEVLNGIQDFEKVTLGYIPTGSSNDFARSMRLPTNPEAAVHNILHPRYYKYIDIGSMNYGTKTRYFAVSSGIGFDAAVCLEAQASKVKDFLNRYHLGKLTYAGIALRQILLMKPRPMTLILDGVTTLKFQKTYFISVMNQPYEGGGIKMCPAADPQDECLDICAIEGVSKIHILLLLPAAFLGKHTGCKGVHIFRCKKADIKTELPEPVHTDGESCQFQTLLSIKLAPKKLRVITND